MVHRCIIIQGESWLAEMTISKYVTRTIELEDITIRVLIKLPRKATPYYYFSLFNVFFYYFRGMPSKYKEKHNHWLLDTSYAMAETIFQANDGFFLIFLQQPLFLNKLCRKLQKMEASI